MSKLKILSGNDLVSVFRSFGFSVVKQQGSHIKLRRFVEENKQILTVPNHKELDKGTTKAIVQQAQRFIPENDLRSHFYTD
jgi:predicted RNA binding protein YcfA (HicA-like mRNA interferase family)